MIGNKVKLVVWDLDETFWRGTLAEEGMTPVPRNAERVVELSRRGIINSICSKNDHAAAKARLVDLGVWDYFVFPNISFNPKGKAIAEMIEAAGLRPENVLFLDDNRSNLEEVKFFNPGIMAAHPQEVLEGLLAHENLQGKPDPELTRLNQYRFLQRKFEERGASTLSNDEFLRASNIKLRIERDIKANFERVVELINRTNQLNYTKARLEGPRAIAGLRRDLGTFGYSAGCVFASDNYGDYGLIGFFLMKRRAAAKTLVHFVFSCRTMNMGIEQYVYETLGEPDIDIVEPVSYGLRSHDKIDWINNDALDAAPGAAPGAGAKDHKLLLLGGCDLLQLASYCSTNRLEFVNRVDGDETRVRYDDPGFVLSDREQVRKFDALLPCWKHEDALRFDKGVAESDLIILCMWAAMNGRYFSIQDKVRVRLEKISKKRIKRQDKASYRRNLKELPYEEEDRQRLVLESFDAIGAGSGAGAHIFVIGASTLGVAERQVPRRKAFNDACRAYCETHAKFRYVDVDTLLPKAALVDKRHFSPQGYYALAQHILGSFGESGAPKPEARAAE